MAVGAKQGAGGDTVPQATLVAHLCWSERGVGGEKEASVQRSFFGGQDKDVASVSPTTVHAPTMSGQLEIFSSTHTHGKHTSHARHARHTLMRHTVCTRTHGIWDVTTNRDSDDWLGHTTFPMHTRPANAARPKGQLIPQHSERLSGARRHRSQEIRSQYKRRDSDGGISREAERRRNRWKMERIDAVRQINNATARQRGSETARQQDRETERQRNR